MGDTEVALSSIPGRIINRYVDNFRYIVDQVLSMANSLTNKDSQLAAINGYEDPFGIKKTLVLLTKPNKVIALSSFSGSIKWSYYSRS